MDGCESRRQCPRNPSRNQFLNRRFLNFSDVVGWVLSANGSTRRLDRLIDGMVTLMHEIGNLINYARMDESDGMMIY